MKEGSALLINLVNGGILKVQALKPHTFRIRLRQDEEFKEPSLIRYGILENHAEDFEFSISEEADTVSLSTPKAELRINKLDGSISLYNKAGRLLTENLSSPVFSSSAGFNAEFRLKDEECLYGLGDVTRDRIEKRGFKTKIWVKNVSSYVPIPYLMSTEGWAILLNTTWKHYIDIGSSRHDCLSFRANHGELDFYLFAGDDFPTLLDRYTDIAGKPVMLPIWAYGLTFVCNFQANAHEMLGDCLNFRREDIPCDIIGLEPGWMENHYDATTEKKWHPERFYLPHWDPKGKTTFISAARRLGFKMSLWLCCDYDLSWYEENSAAGKAAGESGESINIPHPDDFEQDEYIGHEPLYIDKITKREEPWFEHLKKFVDQGVCAFKLDGAYQVNEHPDRKWGNGMDDLEMHNLYPTLLNKQMSLGFKEHTGLRSLIYSSGGYSGIQKYSATWAGDTGGGPKPLVSMLNHGMAGHVNTSCDMDVFTPAGIHFGFFQPWSQLSSWAYWRHPWYLDEKMKELFRFYTRLRYRLIPYIYTMAHKAAKTGFPIMRAMPLVYRDIPEADEMLYQYMFGDSFLTAAFTDRIYLPEGTWIDFWTDEKLQGGRYVDCNIPEDRGGPLFIKAGAMIPYWPEVNFVGEKEISCLELHVYPDGDSSFVLYEDDGITYQYLEGKAAVTRMSCSAAGNKIELLIGEREGFYEGMPEARNYDIWIHTDLKDAEVYVNGKDVTSSISAVNVFYSNTMKVYRIAATHW